LGRTNGSDNEAIILARTLEAATALDSLRGVFESLGSDSPGWTYAAIAKRAGFSSRAFVREVLIGKKTLTFNALKGLQKAMGIKGPAARYQTLLLQCDEDASGTGTKSADLKKRLATLRTRIERGSQPTDRGVYSEPDWPLVYAALGTPEHGATVGEIQLRSGLGGKRVVELLEHIRAHGLCEVHGEDRFRAKQVHVVLEKGVRTEVLNEGFRRAAAAAQRRMEAGSGSGDRLFYSGVTCVRRSRLGEFQERLYELCLDFLDSAEEAEGDAVVQVLCALFPIA